MKVLLSSFEYIKRYHSDVLDCIIIILEILIIKQNSTKDLRNIIQKGNKRKFSQNDFDALMTKNIDKELYVAPNPNINILKILRSINEYEIKAEEIEEFLHIITQKKTTNKLFTYSTPLEINELLIGLLDIQKDELIYNPCYGMGTLFLSFGQRDIMLYGDELDARLSSIAKLICKILKINYDGLILNDILKTPKFLGYKFDKIICNPPLFGHVGLEFLKDDSRFKEILVKSYPELLFLFHCIGYLGHKGVFIIRTQTLSKPSLESGFRKRLCENMLIECIIDLPKNIFPHQNYEFSIIVLNAKHKNTSILHINATTEQFYKKDGKYNRLINIKEILQAYNDKKDCAFAKNTPMDKIDTSDLGATKYISNQKEESNTKNKITLKDLNVEYFRGGKRYSTNKEGEMEFYDIGIADFSDIGLSDIDDDISKYHKGDAIKVTQSKLEPYDILLSLRGSTPKFSIIGESVRHILSNANAGILVLRASSQEDAIGLYCYFFSNDGLDKLAKAYDSSVLNIDKLLKMDIPKDYAKNSAKIFSQINQYKDELNQISSKIRALRESK